MWVISSFKNVLSIWFSENTSNSFFFGSRQRNKSWIFKTLSHHVVWTWIASNIWALRWSFMEFSFSFWCEALWNEFFIWNKTSCLIDFKVLFATSNWYLWNQQFLIHIIESFICFNLIILWYYVFTYFFLEWTFAHVCALRLCFVHKTWIWMLNNLRQEILTMIRHLESSSHSASFFFKGMMRVIFVINHVHVKFRWISTRRSIDQISSRSLNSSFSVTLRIKILQLGISLVEALLCFLVTNIFSKGSDRVEFIDCAVI